MARWSRWILGIIAVAALSIVLMYRPQIPRVVAADGFIAALPNERFAMYLDYELGGIFPRIATVSGARFVQGAATVVSVNAVPRVGQPRRGELHMTIIAPPSTGRYDLSRMEFEYLGKWYQVTLGNVWLDVDMPGDAGLRVNYTDCHVYERSPQEIALTNQLPTPVTITGVMIDEEQCLPSPIVAEANSAVTLRITLGEETERAWIRPWIEYSTAGGAAYRTPGPNFHIYPEARSTPTRPSE